jgi:hypothetical protein
MLRFRRNSWSVDGFSCVQNEMQRPEGDQSVFDSICERQRAVAALGNCLWATF